MDVARLKEAIAKFEDCAIGIAGSAAELEAGALQPRLGAWLAWCRERQIQRRPVFAVAGDAKAVISACGAPGADEVHGPWVHLSPESHGGGDNGPVRALLADSQSKVELIVLVDVATLSHSALALGRLQRDCAGLLLCGDTTDDLTALEQAMCDSALGVCRVSFDPALEVPRLLGEMPPAGPWRTIITAPTDMSLLGALDAIFPDSVLEAVAAVHGTESLIKLSESLTAQQAVATGAITARAVSRAEGLRTAQEAVASQLDRLTEVREHLAYQLQAAVPVVGSPLTELEKLELRTAVCALPVFNTGPGGLLSRKQFEEQPLFHWWQGSAWKVFSPLFNKKSRLSIREKDKAALIQVLKAILLRAVPHRVNQATKRFNSHLIDFNAPASAAGFDLRCYSFTSDDLATWDPAQDEVQADRSLSFRCDLRLQQIRRQHLDTIYVDLERKGPVGRITEGRTAVFGISFLITFTLRAGVLFGGGPTDQVTLTTIAVGLLGFGFVVSMLSAGGREDALLTEKVLDKREAVIERLSEAIQRFAIEELDALRTRMGDARTEVATGLGRAIDGLQQQRDELRERGVVGNISQRQTATMLTSSLRPLVEALRLSSKNLKTEVGKALNARARNAA